MHRRSLKLGLIALVLLPVLCAAPGCIALGGGSKITNPTLGEELTSLKIARDQNAISENEYQNAKAKLLNSPRR